MIRHNVPPIFDKSSKILVLGSFPSVKSREQAFFYAHPQNRFWKVLSVILKCETPNSIQEKRDMLINNHIALWDVIQSCNIVGSDDSSISDVVPNDLEIILNNSNIKSIFANGKTATRLYNKHILPKTHIKAISLPSTSPANAAWNLDRLIDAWSIILDYLV
ncbi:MAG: DNA-deoxyinosine glycosylase [Clostridiales bacterium]|jgi:hypoxanthine-DNA glycosylase|nr:DNA-deoxyinosine glycosylase [Clostridiales bacterium]